MTDEPRRRTPELDKTIERIQFVSVVLLVGTMIAIPILARNDVTDTWKLLVAGFSTMIMLGVVLTLVVSRVERRPFGEVVSNSFRGMASDVKGIPARLRQRNRPHDR